MSGKMRAREERGSEMPLMPMRCCYARRHRSGRAYNMMRVLPIITGVTAQRVYEP